MESGATSLQVRRSGARANNGGTGDLVGREGADKGSPLREKACLVLGTAKVALLFLTMLFTCQTIIVYLIPSSLDTTVKYSSMNDSSPCVFWRHFVYYGGRGTRKRAAKAREH